MATLYVGVSSDLVRRVYTHREKVVDGFTKKYDVDRLVYFEVFEYRKRHYSREALEEMEQGLEGSIDRTGQPELGRFVS